MSSPKPVFYHLNECSSCRSVIAVSRILGIELDVKPMDLSKQDQLKPDFVKLNPFHTIPTLVDTDGFVVWESRSICTYLIQSRVPQENFLYPADVKARTNVDKMLQYDLGTLYRTISDVTYTLFFLGGDPSPKIERVKETLKTFEQYLQTLGASSFVAGGAELTVADISIYFTLTLLDIFGLDTENYPKITKLTSRVEQYLKPYQKEDGLFDKAREGIKKIAATFQAKLQELKK